MCNNEDPAQQINKLMCVCVLVTQLRLTLCYPMDCSPKLLCPWNSPGKNTGVGCHSLLQGFCDSSVGKESACNAGDPSSIPESGRSPGEGIGYSLQYSWASLLTQLVKNPRAMQETWVRSLGWEDRLEKGKATPSSTLAWRIP